MQSKLREIDPGVYVDDELGSVHLFLSEILTARGEENTREHRDRLAYVVCDFVHSAKSS